MPGNLPQLKVSNPKMRGVAVVQFAHSSPGQLHYLADYVVLGAIRLFVVKSG